MKIFSYLTLPFLWFQSMPGILKLSLLSSHIGAGFLYDTLLQSNAINKKKNSNKHLFRGKRPFAYCCFAYDGLPTIMTTV